MSVVKLLVESGANTTHETMDHKAAVSLAATFGHADVLHYLLLRKRDTIHLLEDNEVRNENDFHKILRIFC